MGFTFFWLSSPSHLGRERNGRVVLISWLGLWHGRCKEGQGRHGCVTVWNQFALNKACPLFLPFIPPRYASSSFFENIDTDHRKWVLDVYHWLFLKITGYFWPCLQPPVWIHSGFLPPLDIFKVEISPTLHWTVTGVLVLSNNVTEPMAWP